MISHRFFSIPSSSHKRMTLPLKSMAKHLWHQKKTNRWFRDKHLKECDQMQACSGGRSKRKYRQRSPFGVFISNKSGRLWNISIRMPLVLANGLITGLWFWWQSSPTHFDWEGQGKTPVQVYLGISNNFDGGMTGSTAEWTCQTRGSWSRKRKLKTWRGNADEQLGQTMLLAEIRR